MTDAQREYSHARRDFEGFHVDKARRLIVATDALVAEANRRAVDAQKVLEELRPIWAQGFSSDSEAAQSNGNALAELWRLLAVNNQTDAVARLSEWAARFRP